MALKEIVLTRLVRTTPEGEITLLDRQNCNAGDGPAYSLFEQAKSAMHRSASRQYGFFNPDSEHQQIAGLINNWQSASIDFAGFARRAAQLLQQHLMPVEEAFSCILLSAHESIAGSDNLYFFWLPEVEVIQAGNDLEPLAGRMIAADKVQYGMRLALQEWQDGDSPKYLCYFSLRGNKAVSDAFQQFINFSEGLDTTEQTLSFLGAVDDFSSQLPDDKAEPVKAAILDYCVARDKIGQPVDLVALSGQLDEAAPERFADFVQQRQEQPSQEIYTDRQSLKRYMRYFGRDHSLSISFSADRIDRDIVYDAQSGTLHIHKLPANLKSQLSDFGRKK